MTVDEVTINKYVEGITVINSTLGRLDVLRLHLKDDSMALAIVNTIIDDLASVCGVNYNKINFANIQQEPKKIIKTQSQVQEKNKPIVVDIVEEPTKNIVANIVDRFCKNTQQITDNDGIEIDEKTGNLTYTFKNSHTLSYFVYNKNKKELIVNFSTNNRTYKYKNIPMYVIDNLVSLDERKMSANSYFQQNVVKKWKKGEYIEVTDDLLIG